MKKIIISLCAFFCLNNGFSQGKSERAGDVFKPQIGIDVGFGINSFSGVNDDYTKIAVDLGMIYELREKFLVGLDLSFSPKENHENTGVDGSRSTHMKWDGQATCVEMYGGYKILNRAWFLGGLGACFFSEYEVMKGYSNLTSYKRSSQTDISPVIGVIYEFPLAYSNTWYMKYDMAVGGYDRFSLSAGLKF
ncbi:hypothetical protein D1614_20015 [Maribellus luteus]|uniref:Outer membrane protein beta-barrel domain-containing protein n=1 Tax=Maribellus luteus TaxID=2305463 RepID=A0A399STS2_9BACT|nr:hypothetical protein [Maribellus luteus]RIJ46259.1 hypothetical protein D1614_20015 [Maribellus luteus]